MLKLFYKTIFVSLLCCSLLMLDFSSKGLLFNSAHAESVKTEKINDADLMGTLTMTVVGTLASRMYTYKMTTDIMLAAAGGAAFIAGEVLAFIGLKDVMKGMEQEITRDKKGNINKEQIEALERLKKSYEEAKKTAETKKMLQMAAAAAFAAAGVMAYTMAAGDMAALTTCTTGITTALGAMKALTTTCQAQVAPGPYMNPVFEKGTACLAAIATCSPLIGTYKTAVMTHETTRQATTPSAPGLASVTGQEAGLTAQLTAMKGACTLETTPIATAMSGACTPLVPTNQKGESGGAGLKAGFQKQIPPVFRKHLLQNQFDQKLYTKVLEQKKSKLYNLFETTLGLFFPKAEAALFSMMGIASSAAITYLLATSATLGPTIDFFMLIPQKRAIVWGILAGLTFAATSATNNVISQIDANISKIDAILNGMYSMANGAVANQTIGKPTNALTSKPLKKLNFSDTDYGEVDLNKGAGESLPCYTGSNPKNCKSFTETVSKDASFQGLNIDSQKQLNGILSTADGVNGTSKISGATLRGASAMASSANALRTALNSARKKNDEALKNAKSVFNNDEQTKKLSGLLDKAMRDGLKKANSNPSAMLSTMYGGKGAIGSGSTPAEDAEKSKLAAEALKGAGANVVDINASSGEGADLGITGLEDGSNGQMTPEELAKLNEQNAALVGKATIDEYDLKNDITNDSTTSIFDLITNRYQKSGYPRLFKIKEPQEPAPVTK